MGGGGGGGGGGNTKITEENGNCYIRTGCHTHIYIYTFWGYNREKGNIVYRDDVPLFPTNHQ